MCDLSPYGAHREAARQRLLPMSASADGSVLSEISAPASAAVSWLPATRHRGRSGRIVSRDSQRLAAGPEGNTHTCAETLDFIMATSLFTGMLGVKSAWSTGVGLVSAMPSVCRPCCAAIVAGAPMCDNVPRRDGLPAHTASAQSGREETVACPIEPSCVVYETKEGLGELHGSDLRKLAPS